MRIKFKSRREGPVPMEAVVTISTARGRNEEVIVHRSQIDERGIEVYYIVERDGLLLVELPRQSMSGHQRVPRPETRTASPATRESKMAVTTAFTASPAAAWFSSVARATFPISSDWFISDPQLVLCWY
jgi:hypothetical protein